MSEAMEHSRVAGRFRSFNRRDKDLVTHLRANQTKAELVLWDLLRKGKILGLRFRRQHKIGKFVVDFFSIKCRLAIEVDGPTHLYTVQQDAARTRWLNNFGIKVLRFQNSQVFNNPESVCQEIEKTAKQYLEKHAPKTPLPPPEGEGVGG